MRDQNDFISFLAEKHEIYLNEQQKTAVETVEGPVMLLAVPGAGKTTVIIVRCANMVANHGIDPKTILTLTFSRASALDMRGRYERTFGELADHKLHFSTIHSFCYMVLRARATEKKVEFPFMIENEKGRMSKRSILGRICLELKKDFPGDEKIDEISNSICYIKNMMITVDEIPSHFQDSHDLAKIFKAYEEYKRSRNLCDFDDLLHRTLELFETEEELLEQYRRRYRYINIDESQDTSYLQHRIIKKLANPVNNIFMVGDEDQSIYGFRAAFPKAMLDFEKTYPKARILLMEKNYRSTKNIVAAADSFIKQNNERFDKNMISDKSEGPPVQKVLLEGNYEQAGYIVRKLKKHPDIATSILFRNNISAIPLVFMLYKMKIPFSLRENRSSFFRSRTVKEILSYMKLAIDPFDFDAFLNIYFRMDVFLSKDDIEHIKKNFDKGRDIFDHIARMSRISGEKTRRIIELKHMFRMLSDMRTKSAIDYIINEMGYGKYLKKQLDGPEITGILKYIANSYGDISEYLTKIEEIRYIVENSDSSKSKDAVWLSTIHSSKGLEFDRVFIVDLYDGQFPSAASIKQSENGDSRMMEEEVRLFYVGVTRAKHRLELLTSKYHNEKRAKESRFINDFLASYRKGRKNGRK